MAFHSHSFSKISTACSLIILLLRRFRGQVIMIIYIYFFYSLLLSTRAHSYFLLHEFLCAILLESSGGAWKPTFSTDPAVLNNLLLFTSSTNDRWSNWLRISTSERFLVNLRLSTTLLFLELEAPCCDSNKSLQCL